jgi:hypothetical protein
MKQKLKLPVTFLFLLFGVQAGFAQTQKLVELEQNKHFICGTEVPDDQWELHFQKLIKQFIAANGEKKEASVPYVIPVIIHVVHGGQSVGVYPNLASGQLISQIQALNNDFGGIGYNSGNYPATAFASWAASENIPIGNLDGIGRVKIADCNIQFCLATKDTLGNTLLEPGIDRINYVTEGWSNPASFSTSTSLKNFINGTVKPQSIWNVTQYLNIWVTDNNINANSLLGYATFPAYTGLTGLPSSSYGTNTTDGFWCYARAFGSKTYYPSGTYFNGYDRGRTSTHEIGHWLGLRHIGGDGNSNSNGDCNATDYCDDTPSQKGGYGSGSYGQNFGAPPYPLFATGNSSCPGSSDGCMFMNFMDYTNDNSKYMYTTDQAARMQTAMLNAPYRKFLGTHNLCSVEETASSSQFKIAKSVCQDAILTLTNTSSGIPVPSYTWTSDLPSASFLPDANSASGVIFDTPGTYVITLTTDNGTVSISSETIIVNASPPIALSAISGNACEGQSFDIEATGGNSYIWQPGSVSGSGITYYASGDESFTCTATGDGGCKSSVEISFVIVNCTGVKDLFSNEEHYSVYPNPAKGTLHLKSKQIGNETALIKLLDVSGKVVMERVIGFVNNESQLSIEEFSKGLYFLQLTESNGTTHFVKLVKE